MVEFKKAKKHLYLYIAGLVTSLGIFIAWLVLILNTTGFKAGDIILLALLFVIVVGGLSLFLVTYLRRPEVIVSFNDEKMYIHLSKSKKVEYSFSELGSIGRIRKNLIVMTKKSDMSIIRFMQNSNEVEEALKAALNAFISNHPDRYFDNDLADKTK